MLPDDMPEGLDPQTLVMPAAARETTPETQADVEAGVGPAVEQNAATAVLEAPRGKRKPATKAVVLVQPEVGAVAEHWCALGEV